MAREEAPVAPPPWTPPNGGESLPAASGMASMLPPHAGHAQAQAQARRSLVTSSESPSRQSTAGHSRRASVQWLPQPEAADALPHEPFDRRHPAPPDELAPSAAPASVGDDADFPRKPSNPRGKFLLWEHGAVACTPTSQWWAGQRRGRQLVHGESIKWAATVRTTLEGKHERPKTGRHGNDAPASVRTSAHRVSHPPSSVRSPSALSSSILDGDWYSRADGEYRGFVMDGHMMWNEDGSATPLAMHGERSDVVSMVVDGEMHSGVLSEDGRLLRWRDGDSWKRVSMASSTEYGSDGASMADDADDRIQWSGWNVEDPLVVQRCRAPLSPCQGARSPQRSASPRDVGL